MYEIKQTFLRMKSLNKDNKINYWTMKTFKMKAKIITTTTTTTAIIIITTILLLSLLLLLLLLFYHYYCYYYCFYGT